MRRQAFSERWTGMVTPSFGVLKRALKILISVELSGRDPTAQLLRPPIDRH